MLWSSGWDMTTKSYKSVGHLVNRTKKRRWGQAGLRSGLPVFMDNDAAVNGGKPAVYPVGLFFAVLPVDL